MNNHIGLKPAFPITLCTLLLILSFGLASAADIPLSKGQTLYVSVYSHIYTAPKKIPYNLSALLSVRNTDPRQPISLVAADYYDTHGKLIRTYLQKPIVLAPLASTDIYIPEEDTAGGTGANFIVKWTAEREVNLPIVESVMVGMRSGQGISFVSQGQEIR